MPLPPPGVTDGAARRPWWRRLGPAPAAEPPEETPVPQPLAPPPTLPPLRPMTKRTLITISHAIEQAAVASVATEDEPVVLVALFQRPLYFDRERTSYRQLARSATLTVVGLVDDEADVPPGIEGIALRPDEPLAAEWSVVMLTPRAGAALVARDREEIVAGEASIEKGRLFDGWYSFDRVPAQQQVARLRDAFGDRLSRHARIVVDEVLDEANSRRPNPSEERTDAAIHLLVGQLEIANKRVRTLESELVGTGRRGGLDPLTGLNDRSWLQEWIGAQAGTAGGTLPVALIRLDVNRLRDVNQWYGKDVGDELLKRLGQVVRQPLRDVDHAVRLQDDDLLVLLPGMSEEQATRMAYSFCADAATMRLHHAANMGGLTVTAAVTVTRERPLPLAELGDALAWAKAERLSVVTLGVRPGEEALEMPVPPVDASSTGPLDPVRAAPAAEAPAPGPAAGAPAAVAAPAAPGSTDGGGPDGASGRGDAGSDGSAAQAPVTLVPPTAAALGGAARDGGPARTPSAMFTARK